MKIIIKIRIKRIDFKLEGKQEITRYRAEIGNYSAGGSSPKAAVRVLLRDIVRDPSIARLND